MRSLITGGVRSGKSRLAESRIAQMADGGRGGPVTYLAPGPVPDPAVDLEWADRIERHRRRRPADWVTVETTDVAAALTRADGPVLLDDLGTWVTAVLDAGDSPDGTAGPSGWELPGDAAVDLVQAHVDALVAAWRTAPGPLVAVTNEVGLGVVPEHRSGRLFRDALGLANQHLAAACDEVLLVVAGRVLVLPA
ncbi:bifunctional adenosylcobinamide kinase/adenosylcobinamide-phosphate guanylyltransferase [Nakamurella sp. YIM 132084]|uniref:Adenosylcobinamide kinase n=1 Tax=Nakamurella leprariae TaxID=2803911 RepID=A0A939C2E4_9ACTN|nr:bifunctional adenosylcobinamide kinase/adenosylcobinamide-phosphate guanylyltransferase [Nakamurella leprariae]